MKILNDLVDRVMDSLELFSEEDELTEEDLKPSKSEAPKAVSYTHLTLPTNREV